ncbi:uncharacterized protein [Miscanthus floridulus]|uniref:uncharacterized protein n=1 Tax=Miscanthus floridulus TaxID=154761 RepID=UPI003458AAA4
MAEPNKETAATPPPLPQETVPHAPAAMAEPRLEADTQISASQDTETTGGGAATLDSAQPKAEPAHQPPPPQETVDMAAVGAPEQTTTEADAQPPVATMSQKIAALPPPAETPAQESAAAAAPTPPPPPPQKQEGGDPKLASSVHEEDKGASKARVEEGEEKPARRRWRCLRAAVCLLFLRPKSGETKPATPPGDKEAVSGLEEKKPMPGEMPPPPQKDSGSAVRVPSKPEAGKGEGETKPAALDGKRPEPGQEQVATLPPPAETSSQETTATAAEAGAEKQLAAPAPQQPPRKQEGGAPEQAPSVQEEMDAAPAAARPQEGEEKPARRRWRCLQAAVGLLFLRPKGEETKPPTPGEMPLPVDSAGKAAVEKGEGEMKPSAQDGKKPVSGQEEQKPAAKKPSRKYSPGAARKEKDQGEESKGRRDETQAGKTTPQLEGEHPSLKKFRKAARLVQFLMSWLKKVRSQKSAWSSQKSAWLRERLEHILEEAFTRLLATEYNKELSGVRQKCLLTFSVFELASEVKKQAMIYWWVAEFNLRHRSDPPAHAARAPPAAAGGGGRSDKPVAAPQGKGADADRRDDDAEGIFFMLSDHGFLVPIKNWCSKVIHGCQVNPLVHWMLKRQARGDRFAELDAKGSPADLQLNSSILCLTAGNRPVLQRMRMEDESQPHQARKKDESQAGRKSKKVTKEPSLQSKGNRDQDQDQDQDQQQPTTKDEAQVGSKSMAAADKAPSHKDEDSTQAKEDQLIKGAQNIKSSSELEHVDIPPLFEGKRVILNVNAHVYPISKFAFLNLAECLVVLQLGRWNNLDDKTYMEVDGLDSRNAIGLLKNLRYLGLRGLSRLTKLPKGIESLKKLVILDMRGCQNLVKVTASVITQLKQLTHLDLTECYMLEHIDRGITFLTELQVFKGFVFATGTQGKKACRIQDLKKLKKLQKLTVSITTDANVGKGEMADLKHLTSLRKLTITWSEIPSILKGDIEKVKKKRDDLVERWTSF